MLKKLIIMTTTLFSLSALSQVSIAPAVVGGEIDMTDGLTISLSLANTSGVSQSVNLSVGTGFSISLNRCASTLANNKVCTFKVSVNPAILASGTTIESLMNGASSLVNLKYIKPAVVLAPTLSSTPLSLSFGTLTRAGSSVPQKITIQNTGTKTATPIIQLSPKMSLVINRCLSVKAGKTCDISVAMAPTSDMTNGAITGQSVIIKKDAGDVGQTISASGSLNIVLACAGNQTQVNGVCVQNAAVLTYTATYSAYSPSTASIVACDGMVNSSRTIVSCMRDDNFTFVPTSNCTDIDPSITTPSPAGTKVISILNGSEVVSCNMGSSAQTVDSRTCDSGFENNGASCQPIVPSAGFLSAGNDFGCHIKTDGIAYCWGQNWAGQLGTGDTNQSNFPVSINMLGILSGKSMKSVSSGHYHSCSIASDDQAYCWGYNGQGQLGNGTLVDSLSPTPIIMSGPLSGKTIKAISSAIYASCAIASDDQAYCWGSGILGDGSGMPSTTPVAVSTSGVLSGKTIKSISMAYNHSCVIASDDQAYCWGSNNQGQLGDGTLNNSDVPVAVNTSGALAGKIIKSIYSGESRTCVIADDNQAYCWGDNSNGQLADGTTNDSLVPIALDNITSGVLVGKTIKTITHGGSHSCLIASDNQAYCWGFNSSGQLGNGDSSGTQSNYPISIDTSGVLSGKTIKYITGGYYFTCAVANDDQIYCWGSAPTLSNVSPELVTP